jgi:hypothetical protein
MKKRFTEAQIAFALRQAASGTPIFSYVYFALTGCPYIYQSFADPSESTYHF